MGLKIRLSLFTKHNGLHVVGTHEHVYREEIKACAHDEEMKAKVKAYGNKIEQIIPALDGDLNY